MKVEASCQIKAPREQVFAAFTDLPNLADKVTAITEIEMLTSGPVGVGTKFKETRIMFGKESSEVRKSPAFPPRIPCGRKPAPGGCAMFLNGVLRKKMA